VLDGGERRQARAAEQELALERRPVQGAAGQDFTDPNDSRWVAEWRIVV
jgi:hypothetical protein